jgi:hypothetical protein
LLEPIIWAESLDNEGHKTGRINAFELDEWKKISKNGDKWIIVKKQEPNKYNLFSKLSSYNFLDWKNFKLNTKNEFTHKYFILIITIFSTFLIGLILLIIEYSWVKNIFK